MFNFGSGKRKKSTLPGQVAKLRRRAAKKQKIEKLKAEKAKLQAYLSK